MKTDAVPSDKQPPTDEDIGQAAIALERAMRAYSPGNSATREQLRNARARFEALINAYFGDAL